MNRFIVNINSNSGDKSLRALATLPNYWISENPVLKAAEIQITKSTPEVQVVSGRLIGGPDLTINGYHQSTISKGNEPFRLLESGDVGFIRLMKSYQHAWLNENLEKLQTEKITYRPIPTWSSPLTAALDLSKCYLLKPELGARGMANIFFDASKVTLEKLEVAFKDVINNYTAIVSETSEAAPPKKTIEGCLEALNSAGKVADFVKGWEQYDGEALRLIDGQNSFFSQACLQEHVVGIHDEYRFITGYDGSVSVVCPRTRTCVSVLDDTKPNLSIATGAQTSLRSVLLTKTWDTGSFQSTKEMHLISTVAAAIGTLNLPLHSFDIFVGKDQVGMPFWGIFEFSPEFGMQAIPLKVIQDEAKLFVESNLVATL